MTTRYCYEFSDDIHQYLAMGRLTVAKGGELREHSYYNTSTAKRRCLANHHCDGFNLVEEIL